MAGKEGSAVKTPFTEAIGYFRQKVRIPTDHWTDVYEEGHARAFVVAGAVKDDLLSDFQKAIGAAIKDGETLDDFRKRFDGIVTRHGWTYNGTPGWRSKVIYDTNLRQSHMAGRWRQAQRLKDRRPYLRYVAMQGGDRRPEHQALHGLILPVDDPFWDTHHPANGWGCKCSIMSVSERDVTRNGWKVDEAPAIEWETRQINTPDGKRTVTVPAGIDPGFAANPGKAAWGRQLSDDALANAKVSGDWKKWTRITDGDWKSAGRPKAVPVQKAKAKLGASVKTKKDMASAVRNVLSGDEKVFTLPDGSPLLVNAESLAEHIPLDRAPFIPFLPELVEEPFEIWVSFERHEVTGRVALRKRLLKVLWVEKDRHLVMVANASRGMFEGWTFVPSSRQRELQKQRVGRLLFGQDAE